MKHTISVFVENKFGVLSRVSSLFSAKGYNIESLSVGETTDPEVSRMTIIVSGDDMIVEQIIKQLRRLIDVIKVSDFTDRAFIEREMVLLKVNAEPSSRSELLNIVDIFRGKPIEINKMYFEPAYITILRYLDKELSLRSSQALENK